MDVIRITDTVQYTVARNVPATNDRGDEHLIAIAIIKHRGGFTQHLAINEALIQFQKDWDDPTGEKFIEKEVMAAAASPPLIQTH